MQCFRQDADLLGVDLRILGVDVQPELSSACYEADAAFAVPPCTSSEFVSALLRLCREQGVDLLVPTIDPELTALSASRADFAAQGTDLVVSAPLVIRIARDKMVTADVFAQAGIPVPRTAMLSAMLDEGASLQWPLMIKPAVGSGSVGIQVVHTSGEARALRAMRRDFVVQEFWQGEEYTVGMFFDRSGGLRCAIPHRRLETRGGEVSKGTTERVPVLLALAEKIATVLPGARGPLCFQAIVRSDGEAAVFELNARFGGGYPLVHHAGARFSRWLLEELLGRKASWTEDWRPGVTMLRYGAAIFTIGRAGGKCSDSGSLPRLFLPR